MEAPGHDLTSVKAPAQELSSEEATHNTSGTARLEEGGQRESPDYMAVNPPHVPAREAASTMYEDLSNKQVTAPKIDAMDIVMAKEGTILAAALAGSKRKVSNGHSTWPRSLLTMPTSAEVLPLRSQKISPSFLTSQCPSDASL